MASKETTKRPTAAERGLHPILLTSVTTAEANKLARAARCFEDCSRVRFILDAALAAADKALAK